MSTSSSDEENWKQWFNNSIFSEYLLDIETSYLNDNFNLYGFQSEFSNYKTLLNILRGTYSKPLTKKLRYSALELYGRIHSRYILTETALDEMLNRYTHNKFPRCPRVLCNGTLCLPYGPSEIPNESKMMLFCPNCGDIYIPDDNNVPSIDGSYFGPSWVHLFLNSHPDIIPNELPKKFIPKVFGFKLTKDDDIM